MFNRLWARFSSTGLNGEKALLAEAIFDEIRHCWAGIGTFWIEEVARLFRAGALNGAGFSEESGLFPGRKLLNRLDRIFAGFSNGLFKKRNKRTCFHRSDSISLAESGHHFRRNNFGILL